MRWIEWQERNYAEHEFGLWVVETHDGEFVGDCGLTMQDVEGTPHVEVGYHVMPRCAATATPPRPPGPYATARPRRRRAPRRPHPPGEPPVAGRRPQASAWRSSGRPTCTARGLVFGMHLRGPEHTDPRSAGAVMPGLRERGAGVYFIFLAATFASLLMLRRGDGRVVDGHDGPTRLPLPINTVLE